VKPNNLSIYLSIERERETRGANRDRWSKVSTRKPFFFLLLAKIATANAVASARP
jgi:hypothetical protein